MIQTSTPTGVSPSRWQSWHPLRWTRLSLLALIVYWSALTLGTHLPGDSIGEVKYNDKLIHFLAFAGLAFLANWAWAARRMWLPWKPAVVVGLVCLYAAVDELTQQLIPGRTGQWGDWLADTLGALAGTCAFVVLERLSRPLADRPGSAVPTPHDTPPRIADHTAPVSQ